jgi:hypothetical protein
VSFHATPREGGNVDDGGKAIQLERKWRCAIRAIDARAACRFDRLAASQLGPAELAR